MLFLVFDALDVRLNRAFGGVDGEGNGWRWDGGEVVSIQLIHCYLVFDYDLMSAGDLVALLEMEGMGRLDSSIVKGYPP